MCLLVFYEILAVYIVVSAELVHSLQQLVHINQGTNAEQECAQHTPTPERAGAKAVADTTALQFLADSCADLVAPHNGGDTEGQPGEQECHQAEMGGLLAVITAGDGVDISTDSGHNYQTIDAEGDHGQQNELDQTSVGFQLAYGSGGCNIIFHSISSFLICSTLSAVKRRTDLSILEGRINVNERLKQP